MIFPAWFEVLVQVAFLAAAFCSVAAAAALALDRRRMNRLPRSTSHIYLEQTLTNMERHKCEQQRRRSCKEPRHLIWPMPWKVIAPAFAFLKRHEKFRSFSERKTGSAWSGEAQ